MTAFRRSNAVIGGSESPALALAASVEAAVAARSTGEDRIVKFGRYHLLRSIGRGGMGQVFEAWDTQLERHVAIKLVLHGGAEATLDEARCLARVAHPNVVSVHEVGRVDELVYIAMELVHGSDLRGWLRQRDCFESESCLQSTDVPGECSQSSLALATCLGAEPWPRPWTAIVTVVLAVGRGLAAVHEAGLLHGDVKPGNVLIGRDGRVRVADFGLARVEPTARQFAAAPKPELEDLVRSAVEAVDNELEAGAKSVDPGVGFGLGFGVGYGNGVDLAGLRSLVVQGGGTGGPRGGTASYMAPECLMGAEGGPAADQYGLCVTAWEALFGVRPFAGNSRQAILAAIATGRIERGGKRPAGMPRAVEAVLRRGLAEQPEARWPSIDALCSALERVRGRRARLAAGVRRAVFVSSTMVGLVGLVGLIGLSGSGTPRGSGSAISSSTTINTSRGVGLLSALAEVEERAEQEIDCARAGEAVSSRWLPDRRAALMRRLAAADLPLPDHEANYVAARLDAWVDAWTSLWSRACITDPAVRRCLELERLRFEAVLALLDPAEHEHGDGVWRRIGSFEARAVQVDPELLGTARALVTELGSPTICLDGERGPSLDAAGIRRLAEFSAVERRIESAVLAGAHKRAAMEIEGFDALLSSHEGESGSPELALRRLAVEPWRARVIAATGEPALARIRLRAAIREAESQGHDGLRFALLLEQARLGSRSFGPTSAAVPATGPGPGPAFGPAFDPKYGPVFGDGPTLDDLAVLDGLAERVQPGQVAQAELNLIRFFVFVTGSGGDRLALLADLEASSAALGGQPRPNYGRPPLGYGELRFELAVRRAQLHLESGEFQGALAAAEEATAIGWQLAGESAGQSQASLVSALTIAALSAAMLGECERVRPSLEALWTISERSNSEQSSVEIAAFSQAQRWTSQAIDWSHVRRACPDFGGDLHALLGPG